MTEKKVFFKNSRGQKLVGLLHIPEGSGIFDCVVFAHGRGSAKNTSKATELAKKIDKQNLLQL